MNKLPSRKTRLVVSALALILIIAGFYYYLFAYLQKKKAPSGVPSAEPTFAPREETPTGFPRELILDDKAVIEGGYSVDYGPERSQRTSSFYSDLSLMELFLQYSDYFKNSGWSVEYDDGTYASFSRTVYAKKGDFSASVAIVDVKRESRRHVTVSYFTGSYKLNP